MGIRVGAGFVYVALSASILMSQNQKPERTVKANTVISEKDPKIAITLPAKAIYVGADRWPLYNIADCEVHVFVEVNAEKVVQRLYWIQFEGYLPSKPELTHDYSADPTLKWDGLDFHIKARFGPTDDSVKTGSDSEHVRRLIHDRGFTMPEGMMNVRLVHLLDEQNRKELMLIYGENTASTGFAWTDLMPGGKAAGRWPEIQKGLIDRAEKQIVLKESDEP